MIMKKMINNNVVKKTALLTAASIFLLNKTAKAQQSATFTLRSASGEFTSPDNNAYMTSPAQPLGASFQIFHASQNINIEIKIDSSNLGSGPFNIYQEIAHRGYLQFTDGSYEELLDFRRDMSNDDEHDFDEDNIPSASNHIYLFDTPGIASLPVGPGYYWHPLSSWFPGEKFVIKMDFRTMVKNASGTIISNTFSWNTRLPFVATEEGWSPFIQSPTATIGSATWTPN